MAKILLVEDDLGISRSIQSILVQAGYAVDSFGTAAESSQALTCFAYDLIVMDWELPDGNGIEICRSYRAAGGNAPILMLTGRGHLDQKEIGFGVGVDDYVVKPFQSRELLMRIRALLRRPAAIIKETMTVGHVSIDINRRLVYVDGQEVKLQPIEFDMLSFFFRNRDQVFTPEELLAACWPADAAVSTESVYACVRRLRRKLDSEKRSILTTVHGAGYRLDS